MNIFAPILQTRWAPGRVRWLRGADSAFAKSSLKGIVPLGRLLHEVPHLLHEFRACGILLRVAHDRNLQDADSVRHWRST
jgi:hypothetical protein